MYLQSNVSRSSRAPNDHIDNWSERNPGERVGRVSERAEIVAGKRRRVVPNRRRDIRRSTQNTSVLRRCTSVFSDLLSFSYPAAISLFSFARVDADTTNLGRNSQVPRNRLCSFPIRARSFLPRPLSLSEIKNR